MGEHTVSGRNSKNVMLVLLKQDSYASILKEYGWYGFSVMDQLKGRWKLKRKAPAAGLIWIVDLSGISCSFHRWATSNPTTAAYAIWLARFACYVQL